MKLFLILACMVLVSTPFSAVKADKADVLVCNSVGFPALTVGACTVYDSCFCSTASIGVNGCSGVNACDYSVGLVGADACIGDNACQYTLAAVSIGESSCVGENACQHADASIGANSCVGENSCIGAVALIGAASCIGLESGDSPCGESAGTIGAASCNGDDPCRSLGPAASIGAGTCVGPGTNCHCMNILVGALSCLGEDACVGMIVGSIGAGSCTDKGSCYRATGDIAAGSCTGEGSCYKAGGVIAAGSCTGEGSCWGTKSTFSSAAGSCLGKNSCKCASVIYGAGSCLTEDSCSEVCDIQEDTAVEAAIFCPSRFNTVVNGQTLAEKWAIEENPLPLTSFDEITNVFTQTFEVDDSMTIINTGGEIYDDGCREGGNGVYVQATGVKNADTTMAGTGLVSFTFQLDLNILRLDTNVFNVDPLDPQGANMRFCSRFLLQTDDNTQEVNFLETIITLNFDLTAGFKVDSFSVAPKERIEIDKLKSYGAEAYLCDPTNPSVELDSNVFSQGSLIQVCVKPNQEAIDDGLGIYSIDSFSWIKGSIEQPAIEGGSSASNGLTSFACSPFSEYCSFSSILYANFFKATGAPSPSPSSAPEGGYGGGGGGGYGYGGGGGAYYYTCSVRMPIVNTTKLVHSACVTYGDPELKQYDYENLSIYNYGPTRVYPSPYSGSISNFNSNTRLFGDELDGIYTADIAYDGTELYSDRDESLCEGGKYIRPDDFEGNAGNHSIIFTAHDYNAYNYATMQMRPCFFVIDDDDIEDPKNRRDGDSYHEWLIAEGYNETVTEFDILEWISPDGRRLVQGDTELINSTVVGKMKSYCFDFRPEQCSYYSPNDYGGARDLQSKSSLVGGLGTATLAFPGTNRRKLGKTAGEDRDLQQNESETLDSEIGLSIEVLPQEDNFGSFRTAGGCGLGIEATTSAFFAVVGTGLFLGNILV